MEFFVFYKIQMKNKLGLAQGLTEVLLPITTEKKKTVPIHSLVYAVNKKIACPEHTGLPVLVFIIQRAEILKT